MPRSVFVSYCHKQGEWVWDRLVPCLRAGGAEVLIDLERFQVGRSLVGQMDELQDKAEQHLLVLSPDYLASDYCCHEMERAITTDPDFSRGLVIPVLREGTGLPDAMRAANPLYADLRDDKRAEQWHKLLAACDAEELGTTAPAWLAARDEVRRLLGRGQSVNLVTGPGVAWRALIKDLQRDDLADLVAVDLGEPMVYTRRGLVAEILRQLAGPVPVPEEPADLPVLQLALLATDRAQHLALLHFDQIGRYHIGRFGGEDHDLVNALRHLVMEKRRLVLLVVSRQPMGVLLPPQPKGSELYAQTVPLPGLP